MYMLGNVSLSIIHLLLLPLITTKIDISGYGYYNLIITTGNLVIPLVTLQLTDAVFKFFFNADDKSKNIYFTVTVTVLAAGGALVGAAVLAIDAIYPLQYKALIVLYYFSNVFQALYSKLARSLGKRMAYVKCNLLKAILYTILQIVFLSAFDLKEKGLFLAMIISTFLAILLMEFSLKLYKYFHISSFSKTALKTMLVFSIPLIPNTMLWWINSSFNSYIVTFKLGMDVYGIYTIANKFSSIAIMVSNVFLSAWQEVTIREYKKEGSHELFKEVSNQFICICLSVIAVCLPAICLLSPYLINEAYWGSLPYTPIILLSTGFSSLSGMFGQIYVANGKTKRFMTTTILGVVVNLLFTFLTIDIIGLFAPAIGSVLAYLTITVTRYIDFKKEMGIKIGLYPIITSIEIVICFIVYYIAPQWVNILVLAGVCGISVWTNFLTLKEWCGVIFTPLLVRLHKNKKE